VLPIIASAWCGLLAARLSKDISVDLVFALCNSAPRRVLLAFVAAVAALLLYGVYLQEVVGLVPCPMCIVQRYAMLLLAACAALGAATGSRGAHMAAALGMVLCAAGGAFVAARQSWLQWYPPEVASCGRDFYGMVESFPLQRVIPMIFRGSGDCSKVDWTFLGGSIANWSFASFCGLGLGALVFALARGRRSAPPADAAD
jgi:disulfide bond formation protein DsbB